jgi:hypothetical protein
MLLDYVSLIPGFAAALMGLVLMAEKLPRWKRTAIIILTVIAMGASGTAQWWTSYQKQHEQSQRLAAREKLGKFQEVGLDLQRRTSDPSIPPPSIEADQWAASVRIS